MRSSPFPDDVDAVRLRVETGSPLAEVFVIGHDFGLVERSVGDLDAPVKPGVYKVKATLGDTTAERLILLNEDDEIDMSEQLAIASPAPIEGTSLTHEFHVQLAATESTSVDRSVGSGAQVFLMTRRWSSESADDAPEQSSPSELSELALHAPTGELVVDLARSGARGSQAWDPVAGATVEVDPGPYLLRWCDRSGVPAEQTVQAVPDWQTQVFLLEEAQGPEETARHEVSVLMSRAGFNPDDPQLHVVEAARSALADERKVASSFISETLFAKFENPMLGLFGAHLMLVAEDALHEAGDAEQRQPERAKRPQAPLAFDQSLFEVALSNLGGLLGADHPDVVALSTRSTQRGREAPPPVEVPPMLWRSWLLLIEASNESPELVPVDVWRRAAGLLPMRPFLAWSPTEEEGDMAQSWERQTAEAVKSAVAEAPPTAADDVRRRLTRKLLAPRAAIDELADGPS